VPELNLLSLESRILFRILSSTGFDESLNLDWYLEEVYVPAIFAFGVNGCSEGVVGLAEPSDLDEFTRVNECCELLGVRVFPRKAGEAVGVPGARRHSIFVLLNSHKSRIEWMAAHTAGEGLSIVDWRARMD
jgi:hypothetical protein